MNKIWETIPGHMNSDECEFLYNLAKGKHVLEVGTHHGRSTSALASSAIHVTTIDSYAGDAILPPPLRSITEESLKDFTNILLVAGKWQDQAIDPTKYDMIFYDGSHTEEWEFLVSITGYTGVLTFHDYKPGEEGMVHVVRSLDAYSKATNRALLKGPGSIAWFDEVTI